MNYFNREGYAQYLNYPLLSYNIISALIESTEAEIIWKCLKYDGNDAWSKPNLTKFEKRDLIYNGSPDSQNFRVFMDEGQDDAITTEQTILRIFPMETKPEEANRGVVAIHFQVISHFKTNTMSNYQTKIDTITQSLIQVLNGGDVDGVGALFFNDRYMPCGIRKIGKSPYNGKMLTMAINMG